MFQTIEVSIFLVLLGIILIFFFIYLLKINKTITKIENSINKNQVNKKIIVKMKQKIMKLMIKMNI